jgi:2-polyprenyl-6-methoxyphenol hydroxylase-like FAD-dependent oxidoreductase
LVTLCVHHTLTAMTTRSVLISGAGIAGPALAYWLSRRGVAVTVVERAPAPRPGGQAVDLRGAARTVAERMGLLDAVRAVSVDERGIAWVRDDCSIAARMPADAFGGEGIVSEIEILRGDLTQVLYQASLPDTEYVFDDTVTQLVQDDRGVTVAFERSAPRRFDLVVGADGSHSAVRSLAVAAESECASPLGCYTTWFTVPAELDIDGWFLMHNMPGGRVASVRPGRLPGEHKVGLSFRSAPLAFDRADVGAQKALVAERFAGAAWEVPRLIAAMHAAQDFVLDSMAQVRLPSWSRGRVVLLGDAAWCPTPLTGLGTSLAMVGAYVLAGELTSAGSSDIGPVGALRRYETFLRPYVTGAQKLPPGGVKGFAPTHAVDIRARRASMRLMTRWPMKQLIAKQFDKAEDIVLPDYLLTAVT